MIGLIISVALLVGIDQALKIFIQVNQIGVIEKIKFLFIEIGYKEEILMLFNYPMNIISIIISIILIILFIILFFNRYAKNVRSRFNFVPFMLVLSGLISNFITKIFKGFSIKYLSMPRLLSNTFFNLADIYIFIGLILLIGFYLIKIVDGYTLNEKKENEADADNSSK